MIAFGDLYYRDRDDSVESVRRMAEALRAIRAAGWFTADQRLEYARQPARLADLIRLHRPDQG